MSEKNWYKNLIVGLIFLGAIFRLTVYWVSPANNSYDDHLEVIKIYSEELSRPAPFQCWECYQPPLYYITGACVYNLTKLLGATNKVCWKIVQLINPIFSLLVIFIIYQILLLYRLPQLSVSIILSFIIVLPRDIFTSVMIGNDYMLVFFAALSLYLFLKTVDALNNQESIKRYTVLLVIVATLGSLTKQHGLLLNLFPMVIFMFLLKKINRRKLTWVLPVVLIGFSISISDELWKYHETGQILVSNQHYFDYAKDQFPGSLGLVEFNTFKIIELFNTPYISEKTSASFFSEIFARTFFDYEWRFISPKIPWVLTLGYISYSIGLLWMLYYFFSVLLNIRGYIKNLSMVSMIKVFTPFFLGLLYCIVPIIQTMRYPYFSSMKSMFMLPGILLILIILGVLIKQNILLQNVGKMIMVLNVIFGLILVLSVLTYMDISVNHLHGPLWHIPQ